MLMNLLQKTKILVVIVILFTSSNLFSQTLSSPIDAGEGQTQKEFGAFVGFGSNLQNGTMNVSCTDCNFKGGAKFGYVVGVLYEFDLSTHFMLGASLSYEDRSFSSYFSEYENINIQRNNGSTPYSETVPVLFKHTADVSLNTISISPYIKWNIADYLFIRSGISAAFPLTSTLEHRKEIGSQLIKLGNGETISPTTISNASNIMESGDIPGVSNPLFYVPMTVGFNIPLAININLSPEFQYNLPVNTFSSRGKDLTVSSWYLLLELRIAYNLRGGNY